MCSVVLRASASRTPSGRLLFSRRGRRETWYRGSVSRRNTPREGRLSACPSTYHAWKVSEFGEWTRATRGLQESLPGRDYLFPAVRRPRTAPVLGPSSELTATPAKSSEVIEVLRALLMLPPLSMTEVDTKRISGHSLRLATHVPTFATVYQILLRKFPRTCEPPAEPPAKPGIQQIKRGASDGSWGTTGRCPGQK